MVCDIDLTALGRGRQERERGGPGTVSQSPLSSPDNFNADLSPGASPDLTGLRVSEVATKYPEHFCGLPSNRLVFP